MPRFSLHPLGDDIFVASFEKPSRVFGCALRDASNGKVIVEKSPTLSDVLTLTHPCQVRVLLRGDQHRRFLVTLTIRHLIQTVHVIMQISIIVRRTRTAPPSPLATMSTSSFGALASLLARGSARRTKLCLRLASNSLSYRKGRASSSSCWCWFARTAPLRVAAAETARRRRRQRRETLGASPTRQRMSPASGTTSTRESTSPLRRSPRTSRHSTALSCRWQPLHRPLLPTWLDASRRLRSSFVFDKAVLSGMMDFPFQLLKSVPAATFGSEHGWKTFSELSKQKEEEGFQPLHVGKAVPCVVAKPKMAIGSLNLCSDVVEAVGEGGAVIRLEGGQIKKVLCRKISGEIFKL